MRFAKLLLVFVGVAANCMCAAASSDAGAKVSHVQMVGLSAQQINSKTKEDSLAPLSEVLIEVTRNLPITLNKLVAAPHIAKITLRDGMDIPPAESFPVLEHVTSLTVLGLNNIANLKVYLKVFPNLQELYFISPSFSVNFLYKTHPFSNPNHRELQKKSADDARAAIIRRFLDTLEPYAEKGGLKTIGFDESIYLDRVFKESLTSGPLKRFEFSSKFVLRNRKTSRDYTTYIVKAHS